MILIVCEKYAPHQGCHGRRANLRVPRWLGRCLLWLAHRRR